MIEYIEYRVVLVQSYLQSGITLEWYVAEYYAQSDRYEQKGFKVFLYCQPHEQCSNTYHDDIAHLCVGKARVTYEVIEITYDKFVYAHLFQIED